MKVLKWIGIVIGSLVAIVLAVAFFMPNSYKVERSLVINAPADSIFADINDLSKWTQWSPWEKSDTAVVYTFNEVKSGPGALMSWDGPKMGKGKYKILKAEQGKLINAYAYIGMDENSAPMNDDWIFTPDANGTKVTWISYGSLDYPMGRLFGPLLEGMIGTNYEKGLQNLKQINEK